MKNSRFRDCDALLRKKLERVKCIPYYPPNLNCDLLYRHANYNGSFHKGLQHNLVDGRLVDPKIYEKMIYCINHNDQKSLAKIPLALNSTLKFVNPLASNATILIGAQQDELLIDVPPALDSKEAAAEMVELYCQVLARDVPFIEYPTNMEILPNILQIMNEQEILKNLPYYSPHGSITRKTLFQGPISNTHVGPHISQFLLLNIPKGNTIIEQKYIQPLPKSMALGRIEWGINARETIDIQNGNLNLLPPTNNENYKLGYIYSGRSLAEFVHNDPPFQMYLDASEILNGLGAKKNIGFPAYPNHMPFITNGGLPYIATTLGLVCGEALKHSWYWKWSLSRKLRLDVFGLWIDNVKNDRVSNKFNFNISDTVLSNRIMDDIKLYNSTYGDNSSYTLSLTYREGSPLHPSYPSGHAVISGACCTALKIFYDTSHLWSSLPGVKNTVLSPNIANPVISSADGKSLQSYLEPDANQMTIDGEINKLASNAGFGRNWAGVHYRSDIVQGLNLGEQVAIHVMEDVLNCCVENNLDGTVPKITFRKFDGSLTTIQPTLR